MPKAPRASSTAKAIAIVARRNIVPAIPRIRIRIALPFRRLTVIHQIDRAMLSKFAELAREQ